MCYLLFQAEDGIRDLAVTGVQTCALPIAPADTPRSTAERQTQQEGLSEAERQRQALELQEEVARKKMLAARQRSAIFATAKDDGFAQGRDDQDPAQQPAGGSLLGGNSGNSGRVSRNANENFASSTY